jgi:hypothetical protein
MIEPTPRAANRVPTGGLPPQISNLIVSGGTVNFNFSTVAGRTYRVDFKDNLNVPDWTPLGANQVATGTSLSVIDNIGVQAQRFYRIVQLP